MIAVQHVSVALEGQTILHDVSFGVRSGTVAGYVGPNGAGKTTTLRLLTGTLEPAEGQVIVAGIDIAKDPLAAKQRFGYVPEHGHLYESFTPTEYMAFIGRMHGLSENLIAHRTKALLEFWGLGEETHKAMIGFSKGMKQKVLISAALLHEPDVLLLDEPLNGLDAHAVLQVRALLRAQAKSGKTVFYSSHLLDAVEKVADQVIVIRGGRIIRDGSPAEIIADSGEGTLEEAFSRLTAAEDAAA
ncbi:MAG: ABC transporter ATP-binding protein, partial [Rubricoccaceae bacterium]|nr:ABC transporter ATP-binding protein [Rubricoccaceae bacterium]